MSSTYSPNLAIELIGTGDQAGAWGNTTNTNLGTLIEQAISGYVTQAVSTGATTTITIPNGATGVARNMYIELTGTGGVNTFLEVPSNKKLYFIYNNSSGAVTVRVAGQTGVAVAVGEKKILASNGTDVVEATTYIISGGSGNLTTLSVTSANITTLTGTTFGDTGTTNLRGVSGNITTLTGSIFGTTATTQLRGASANITIATLGAATVTTLAATSGSITNLTVTSATVTTLGATSAAITTLSSTSASITTLSATSASVTTISGTSATYTSATVTNASLTSLTLSNALAVTSGGTGATSAANARTNLGLAIGTDIPSPTGTGASGTWNISITGNAATATSATTASTATQVSNAVTFNNGGSGAASGSSFNGSSALTVSYNTVGAPSTTGTNASGTWGISISGNAATATNGVVTTGSYSDPSWITALAASKLTGTVAVANGGTALSSTPTNGQLLIGNGTNYTLAALTAGTGISVTNGAGSISIASTVSTGDITFSSGTISTANTNQDMVLDPNGTGKVIVNSATSEFTNTGFQAISAGSNVYAGGFKANDSVREAVQIWNAGTSGDNQLVNFGTEGSYTSRGSITYNRGAGQIAYNVTSDRRTKTITGPVTNSGEIVDELNVYTGKMNWGTIEYPMMIADEAQQVTPYCVTGQPNAVDENGNPIYQQIDYSALVPLLLAEIQSLRARVATLEAAP